MRRRRLPPPAASTVYELTEYGKGLRPVLHELAHWGARVMGPPTPDVELAPGWLTDTLGIVFPPSATGARIEFRIGDEVASLVDGDVIAGPAAPADAVLTGDLTGFYHLVVDRDLDAMALRGSRSAVSRILEKLPRTIVAPSSGETPAAA